MQNNGLFSDDLDTCIKVTVPSKADSSDDFIRRSFFIKKLLAKKFEKYINLCQCCNVYLEAVFYPSCGEAPLFKN